MHNCKLFLFYLSCLIFNIQCENENIEIRWIEQKLDHFHKDSRTFRMRYLVKEDYFKPNGTIFFLMGGDESILTRSSNLSNIMLTNSYIHDLAKKYEGYLIHSEHRYYGESRPTKDLHLKSLKYLSVPQALADVAELIRFLKSNTTYFGESKVFLVGVEYAGFMVPWFAKHYHSLFDLGWASSAPFQFKTELWQFYKRVFNLIKKIGGKQCYDNIAQGFKNLKTDITNHNTSKLVELNICGFDIRNNVHTNNLFQRLTKTFGTLVQYRSGEGIQRACNYISKFSFFSYLNKRMQGSLKKCYDTVGRLELLRNTEYITDSTRLWFYQACGELGNFQTTDYIPLDFWTDLCEDVFGYRFSNCFTDRKVEDTDINFKDLESNEYYHRIFLTQPELDAWSAIKVRKHNRTYALKGATHSEDLQASTENEKPSIKMLRMDIDIEVQKLQAKTKVKTS